MALLFFISHGFLIKLTPTPATAHRLATLPLHSSLITSSKMNGICLTVLPMVADTSQAEEQLDFGTGHVGILQSKGLLWTTLFT